MRYLKFSCDFNFENCLKDQFSEFGKLDFQLNDHLVQTIKEWHNRYQIIIPMSQKQRSEVEELIYELDKEGISLAKSIAGEIEGPVKVQYFSEGQLKLLYPTVS